MQVSEFAWSNRFVFSANQIVRPNSENAQIGGKFVNRGLPMLDFSQGSRFLVLTKRGTASGTRIVFAVFMLAWASRFLTVSIKDIKCIDWASVVW